MQVTISGKQFIGFTESAEGQDTFRSTDPQTGKTHPWNFTEATEAETDRAAALAATAFASYSRLSGPRRAQFLQAAADALEEDEEALVAVYIKESGLPEGRARGELGRTTSQLRLFADMADEGSWIQPRIDTAQPDRKPLPRPDIRKCLVPMGPVVVFGASNFPFAFSVAGGDTASALAAGCPVIVKGHPMHPGTGELAARSLLRAARETKMPDGVFSYLCGTGRMLGERLVSHPAVAAVGFTGSRAGGLALAALAASREVPIPFFAEMGSVNPVVLLPSALDPDRGWAKSYAGSVTLGVGQFCTNPGLLFGLGGTDLERFATSLAGEIDAVAPSCMLHSRIAEHYRESREKLLSQKGVRLVSGGEEPDGTNQVPATVALVSGEDFRSNPVLQEEVFGPFTLVVACADEAELRDALSGVEGQLTGSLLGSEKEFKAHPELIATLQGRVGRLLFNGVPTGVEVCASMQHGGPFPATTDARFTSVGTDAVYRWVRPVAFQNCPQSLLPEPLKNGNPLGIIRLVNGSWSDDSIITL